MTVRWMPGSADQGSEELRDMRGPWQALRLQYGLVLTLLAFLTYGVLTPGGSVQAMAPASGANGTPGAGTPIAARPGPPAPPEAPAPAPPSPAGTPVPGVVATPAGSTPVSTAPRSATPTSTSGLP